MYLSLPWHLPASCCPMYDSLSSAVNESVVATLDHNFKPIQRSRTLHPACFSLQCPGTGLVVIGGLLILIPMKMVISEFAELLCCFWEFCLLSHSSHSLISWFVSYHTMLFWRVISLTFYSLYKIIPLSISVPSSCCQC